MMAFGCSTLGRHIDFTHQKLSLSEHLLDNIFSKKAPPEISEHEKERHYGRTETF